MSVGERELNLYCRIKSPVPRICLYLFGFLCSGALVFNVHGPDVFAGSGDDEEGADEGEGEGPGGEDFDDAGGTAKDDDGVEDDEGEADFGGADAEVGDFEFGGGGEGEEGVDHEQEVEEAEDEEHGGVDGGDEEAVAHDDGTHKDEVEKVVHVEAPFGDAEVAVAAECSVEGVGEPLHEEHDGGEPEEME